MTLFRNIFLFSSIILGMLATGCSSKNSDFYILNSAKFSNIQHKVCRNRIMVDRVKIPEYIDKPEIVTRIDQNQLFQAEFHRWAEPLGGNINDVLVQNLALQLKHDWILTYPRLTTSPINYYLSVNVSQFDVDSRGISILKATWSVYDRNRRLMIARDASYRFYAANPNNYGDVTSTMNKNITALSRDIALYLSKLGCD